MQNGELESTVGTVDRSAFGVSGAFLGEALRWTGRTELRRDRDAIDNEQWLMSNRVDWKLAPGFQVGREPLLATVISAFPYSRTLVGDRPNSGWEPRSPVFVQGFRDSIRQGTYIVCGPHRTSPGAPVATLSRSFFFSVTSPYP